MRVNVAPVFVALAAALCGAQPAAAGEVTLTSDQIARELVGKEVNGVSHNGSPIWMRIGADGSVLGKVGGRDVVMTYQIRDNKWCRTIGTRTECQTVTLDGDTLRIYRADGTLSSSLHAVN